MERGYQSIVDNENILYDGVKKIVHEWSIKKKNEVVVLLDARSMYFIIRE